MFKYTISFYDQIDGDTWEEGIVSAETYGKAADILVNYYGRSWVNSIELKEIDCDETAFVTKDELKKAFDFTDKD